MMAIMESREGDWLLAPRKYEFNAYNLRGECYTLRRIEVASL
jgi:hypothetical protein